VTDDHPTPETLDRLLAGASTREESARILAHLADRCEACARHVRGALARAGRPPGGPEAYDQAFAGSLTRSAAGAAGIHAEQLEAAALWATIEGTPEPRRGTLIASDPRYHTWPLAARFLAAAAETHWQDGPGRVAACRLALAIAERLPEAAYPPGLTHDLVARALGSLAEALRLAHQPDAARAALRRAGLALKRGTGDDLERAGLLRVGASLELASGQPGAAARLLRQAAATYQLYGDRHEEGRTIQKLALVVGHDDPALGADLAEQALELIDPVREPRCELAARHALAWFLNDRGLGWEALDLLERTRPLYLVCRESQPRLTLPWLEARICRGLGRLDAAARGLAAVWHDFREAGFRRELTLVSLDLAEVYLAQEKARQASRLLRSFRPTLARWRMHEDGIARWLLLIDAAPGEPALAQALTREATRYYRRTWPRLVPLAAGAAAD
jgi:hypothetical protein